MLALAAVAGGAGAQQTAEATGPGVVRLTDHETSTSAFGSGIGGGRVARYVLYGAHGPRPIGHAVLICVNVGAHEQSCRANYVLPLGTIATEGLARTRLLYTNAVVGGTGFYNDARGTLTVTARSIKPRNEILLFRLTG